MPDTRTGVKKAPTLEPILNHPVVSALSFLGNHSATVFTAAGKLADSPIPSKNRARENVNTLLAAAWAMLAILHNVTAKE